MQTKQLGNTNLELTGIGLGAWAIGGPWEFGWGPQDDNDSVATILKALEEGINWIDTAPIYGCGHSEEVVGKAIKQISSKTIIATKCGLLWNDKRQKVNCLKNESIRKECHNSLKRLGVDVIDLYQIHWPQPDEDIEQAWEEMVKLKEEGKVRYIGVSNFSIEQIKRAEKIHPAASLQPNYSMLHREVENELLGYCEENNIGVVVFSPMNKGLLTGKFSAEHMEKLAEDDYRRRNTDFLEPTFGANLKFVDQLRPIAQRKGMTLAQLAICWVLRRNEVTSAIVGARRPEQITETTKAVNFQLDEQDIGQIDELLKQRLENIADNQK
ncbi:MAG: aldo/keto reductase [Planctomycetota bacterium]|jgi:aryl-alcohol dehydrogenase-like predicted oxidoreductase